MNYEDMSRFEINKLVAMHESLIINESQPMAKRATGSEVSVNDIVSSFMFNPCSEPSDAWPIILKTKMTIELADPNLGGIGTNTIYNPRGSDWHYDYEDNEECFYAAMICFLKMKDAENEK